MIEVDVIGGATYPVSVTLALANPDTGDDLWREFCLTIEEARELACKLDEAAEEAEDAKRHFVQVEFGSRRYTYLDPSGTLTVGDQVLLPPTGFGNSTTAIPHRIVALGKAPGYSGPYKNVLSKVVPLAGQGEEA